MDRPDMDDIKEEFRIFERPSAFNSKRMYDYILELESKLKHPSVCPKCKDETIVMYLDDSQYGCETCGFVWKED